MHTFYKVRTVQGGLYLKPAYRNTQWIVEPEKAKSYSTQHAARSAAQGFLRAPMGEGFARLTQLLGRAPVAADLELVEFTTTETGTSAV